MAAEDNSKLRLQLLHGQERHTVSLCLEPEEGEDALQVAHLAREVEHLTLVPLNGQKLIFKGKSLTDPAQALKELGLRGGSKVMLIGKKNNVEDIGLMQKMETVERSLNRTEEKLNEIFHEVDGIHRGFLAAEHCEEALVKLTRRVAVCSEELTRLLECLDGLVLAGASIEARATRKSLVARIQKQLSRCDDVQGKTRELEGRVKKKTGE